MLQTKLLATGVQDAYHIQYVPVKFTDHADYMVGEWSEDKPDRLTIHEPGTYYLIGNIEWQEVTPDTFYRTAIYQYGKHGNQRCWLDSMWRNGHRHTSDRVTGASGLGRWGVSNKQPLSKLMPADTSGYYAYGEIHAEPGDYITMVGEHAGFDNRHMAGNIFLLATRL